MKSVAIISFFPAFNPPRSGGELRLHHIAMQVANRGFNVEMVSPTFGDAATESIAHHERFVEHRFPKKVFYNRAHHVLDRAAGFSECSGLVCSLVSRWHGELRRKAHEIADRADIITQESPFLAPLVPRRRRANQLFVYNSYNVETRMARDMFGTGPAGRLATRRIRGLEKQLLREADVVLTCSREDSDFFVLDFGIDRSKIVEIPNGVDTDTIRPNTDPAARAKAREALRLGDRRPVAFFIGSYHPPNIEAAQYIIQELAPQHRDVFFFIAGRVCDAFRADQTPLNLHLMGLIDEQQKEHLTLASDVALNPIISGSGTNLKMLEYFAAGLPVLTTPKGARGLDIEDGHHAIVRPLEQFHKALEKMVGDAALRTRLGHEARAHAETNFAWSSIGARVADVYTMKSGRRTLILCDYPVTPAEAGGPRRVEAVAQRLAREGRNVTILTLSPEDPGRRMEIAPRLEELNIPRGALQRLADGLISNRLGSSADDTSALLLARLLSRKFRRALRREARFADTVIFEHPYLAPFLRDLPRKAEVFYDSHNSEYLLKEKLYRQTALGKRALRRVEEAERLLSERARAVFCVSAENLKELQRVAPVVSEKGRVCPNGVNTAQFPEMPHEEKLRLRRKYGLGVGTVAVFVGSEHLPNRDAAFFMADVLAAENPRMLFLLIGSVCNLFRGRDLPENVLTLGVVEEEVKNRLLALCDVALNPMQRGSGTSLKLFEFLAAGLPTITTRKGARGLNEQALKAVIVAKLEEFTPRLQELQKDLSLRTRLSAEARQVAAIQYDWEVVLGPMADALRRGE